MGLTTKPTTSSILWAHILDCPSCCVDEPSMLLSMTTSCAYTLHSTPLMHLRTSFGNVPLFQRSVAYTYCNSSYLKKKSSLDSLSPPTICLISDWLYKKPYHKNSLFSLSPFAPQLHYVFPWISHFSLELILIGLLSLYWNSFLHYPKRPPHFQIWKS